MDENASSSGSTSSLIRILDVGWLKRVTESVLDRSSAVVLFLVLASASLACLLSSNDAASQSESIRIYNTFLHLTIGYEFVAVFVLALVMCFARFAPGQVADADLQPWHQFIRRNIRLFGIGMFYVAVFAYSVFGLVAKIKCVDAWNACADADVREGHVTDLAYTCVRLFYLTVVLVFCVKFNATHFVRGSPVLIGLAVVEAANVSDWLKSIVDESEHAFSSKPNWTYEMSVCFNSTNATGRLVAECFSHASEEFKLLHSLTPYLYWLIMEYLMLVIEAFAEWFFSNDETAGGFRHIHVTPSTPAADYPTTSRRQNRIMASPPTECIPLYGNRITSYGSTDAIEQWMQENNHASDNRTPAENVDHAAASTSADPVSWYTHTRIRASTATSWWVFFGIVAASLVINFLFVIVRVYDFVVVEENPDWTVYQYAFVGYRIFYWLALSSAALVGYAVAVAHNGGATNLTIFECFVLFCCIGPIMQSMFSIISAAQNINGLLEDSMKNCTIAKEAFNVVQVCVQVVLYVHAKDVRIRTDGDVGERRRLRILTCIMTCVVVCNFSLWVENSIETRESTNSWEKHYFRNWPLIYSIFNPFSLVFRFNSALLFLDAVLDKGRSIPDNLPEAAAPVL